MHSFCRFFEVFLTVFVITKGIGGKQVDCGLEATRGQSSFGSWESPISAQDVAASRNSFTDGPLVDPVTGYVFWVETNKDGIGIVKQYNPHTKLIDQWTNDDYDVSTWINGHGGGALLVYNNTIYFSNGYDGYLYMKIGLDGIPFPLTNNPFKNYADGSISPEHNVIFYVVEDMEPAFKGTPELVTQHIVALNITSLEESMFPNEADFFMSPRISPDNSQLAWIQYSYPHLPWEETQLVTTPLSQDRYFAYLKYIQHGSSTSLKWTKNNEMLYVHDATNWWNLYHINKKNFEVSLTPQESDVGKPPWRLGKRDFDINPNIFKHEVVVAVGEEELYEIDTRRVERKKIETTYNVISTPVYSQDGKKIYMLAGNSTKAMSLIELEKESGTVRVLSDKNTAVPLEDYLSIPTGLEFPTTNGSIAYGYFYEPMNPLFCDSAESLPPLIVNIGHGPFDSTRRDLNMEIQYFTSRGFAVFDVDYRGSSGYGRKYIEELYEKWGILDVDDVIAGANYVIKNKNINSRKVAIRASSFGAFTALLAMASSDAFQAGAITRGLSDLFTFYEESSKYDQMLIEHLIGGQRIADGELIFASPLVNIVNITSPILFVHGSEDQYISSLQSQTLHEKLKEMGMATSFAIIEGETHFFNKHRSIVEALETELLFFSQIFNFQIQNTDRKINIENLEKWRSSAENKQQMEVDNLSTQLGTY